MVEEPFTLFKPMGASGGDAEEDRVAGDGCYGKHVFEIVCVKLDGNAINE